MGLVVLTFAVFGQTLRYEFVDFDDNQYVYNNPVVARGLTLRGAIWAFTGVHADNWHPLTWLSHMLDCQLYGLHPGGHHLTNVLLHTATVLLLFLVLRRMTGALWRSALVAAVFAVHPLRVESVAWIAERKDVLSGLFFMLTIGAYIRYAHRAWSPIRYSLVVILFASGLMCKPMLVTLPVVLWLLDYWPLQRVESPWRLVLEKVPLLVLSAAVGTATLLAQHGARQSADSFAPTLRLANALASGMIYLRQMVFPTGLAVLYPYPRHGLPLWQVALAGGVLAGLSVLAVVRRRSQPWLLVGWLWYLVMLLPVLGVIQVGQQAHADRYTYLPQIGLCLAVTWLAAESSAKWQMSRVVTGSLAAAGLAALTYVAWKQTAYWKESETLWSRTLACTTGNYVAQANLGNAVLQKGRVEEAITHLQRALQIRPDYMDAHVNLGNILLQKGSVDAAITEYQAALQINPDASAYCGLGNALLQQGRVADATALFQKALQVKPDYAAAYTDLGNILLQAGRVDEAMAYFQQALDCQPSFAAAHYDLGNALRQKGRLDEAIMHYQEALQINPDYAEAHVNLGTALGQQGKVAEAITQFQKALQIQPADPKAPNNLAWLLATCADASLRNGSKAVELAQQANRLTGGTNPVVLHTLAAALAEAGRFGDATSTAQKALELARAAAQSGLARQLTNELQRYAAGLPLHP